MIETTNTENLQQGEVRFSFIVEQIPTFASRPKMVREVKNLSPNFKQMRDNGSRYWIFSFGYLDSFYS